jgi:hypothetical protein
MDCCILCDRRDILFPFEHSQNVEVSRATEGLRQLKFPSFSNRDINGKPTEFNVSLKWGIAL